MTSRSCPFALGVSVVVVVVVVAGGCSLVYSSDLNAARSVESSANTEAGVMGDGSSGGGVDGSSSGGDGPITASRGCAAYPAGLKFCQDFDDPNKPLNGGWDEILEQGGNVTRDTTLGYSGTGSAKISMMGASSCTYTRLERGFENIGLKRASIHMRMRPTSPWGGDFAPLLVVLKPGAGQYCGPILYVESPGNGSISRSLINVQYGSDPQKEDVRALAGFPTLDEWTDFGMDIVPAASGNGSSITFSYVHENGVKEEQTHDFPQCRLGGGLFLAPGFHCDSGTAEVRYDDIRVDWE